MVALLCLLEAVKVRLEVLLVRPRGAVNALELRSSFVAAPVRAGDLLELEVAEASCRWNVRTGAHIKERVGVAVVADNVAAQLTGIVGTSVAARDLVDDFELVRFIFEKTSGLLDRNLVAVEGLIGFHQLAHTILDRLQIIVGKGLSVRQVEVVVEAVFDRRTDRKGGAGVQIEDRLSHQVRRRMAQRFKTEVIAVGNQRYLRTVAKRNIEVHSLTIDSGD